MDIISAVQKFYGSLDFTFAFLLFNLWFCQINTKEVKISRENFSVLLKINENCKSFVVYSTYVPSVFISELLGGEVSPPNSQDSPLDM